MNTKRDRQMAERIMALVGGGGIFDEDGTLIASDALIAEFVVAGLAVVASEVQLLRDYGKG